MKLFDVYPLYPVTPVSAKGCKIIDDQGKEYLDFYGGHAVISIGHGHPHYIKKITDQIHKIGFYSNAIINPLQEELASLLGSISGLVDYQLFLCNSGAEANENALKLASFFSGRSEFIAFKNAFHGRTSAAVNLTDNPKIQSAINRSIHVHQIEIGDLDQVEKVLNNHPIAGIILEPIQGVGGLDSWDADSLEQLHALCKKHDALLIADEIQSGYGRTGDFFAYQVASIQPDLITVAKGMGNGFPMGGVLIHPKIKPWHGMLGTTFGGNHLACAAGLAVLEVINNEGLISNARKLGNALAKELKELPGVIQIKGRGLMIGLEMESPVAELRKRLIFEHQIFTGSAANPNVIRMLPPLTISNHEVELFIDSLTAALNKTSIAL